MTRRIRIAFCEKKDDESILSCCWMEFKMAIKFSATHIIAVQTKMFSRLAKEMQ